MSISRRNLLTQSAAFAAAVMSFGPAQAKAPLAGAQIPGVFRYKVGSLEVTALLDGYLDIEHNLFPAADAAETGRLLGRSLMPNAPIRTPVNAFLVNSSSRTVLVDTGSAKLMGPTMGDLPANLKVAGIDPAAIDTVLLTHLHPDHVNGLITADGSRLFPNAEIVIPQTEVDFWLDEAVMSRAPADAQPFFKMAQAATKPYASQIRRISGNADILPGITPIAQPGHTPGHTGYIVSSGNDSLWIWGDIVHAMVLQIAHPDWTISFDTDPAQAAATRKSAFDRAASHRIAVVGAHIPFPGHGRIVREGSQYGFVPTPWSPTL